MKLWLVTYTDYFNYTNSAIVRAETESAARNLVAENQAWRINNVATGIPFDPKKTTCIEVTADGDPDVIVVDFYVD